MSRLIHYSERPLVAVRSATQEAELRSKPVGLWISVEGEDDWPAWCRDANFHIERLACATEVVLREDARILRISTLVQLDDFHAAWARDNRCEHVRWDLVARTWHGIVIAPYQWNRRLDLTWYYPWDCASGCIWDASAIAALRPVAGDDEVGSRQLGAVAATRNGAPAAPTTANAVRDPASPCTVVRDTDQGRKDGTG